MYQLQYVITSNSKTYFYDRNDRVYLLQQSGYTYYYYNFNQKGRCKAFNLFDDEVYCVLDDGYVYLRKNNDDKQKIIDFVCTDVYVTENYFLCVNGSFYIEWRNFAHGM